MRVQFSIEIFSYASSKEAQDSSRKNVCEKKPTICYALYIRKAFLCVASCTLQLVPKNTLVFGNLTGSLRKKGTKTSTILKVLYTKKKALNIQFLPSFLILLERTKFFQTKSLVILLGGWRPWPEYRQLIFQVTDFGF